MTRRDYVAIAAALRLTQPTDVYGPKCYAQWLLDVAAVADVLASDNPRFDRARFLKACGVQS